MHDTINTRPSRAIRHDVTIGIAPTIAGDCRTTQGLRYSCEAMRKAQLIVTVAALCAACETSAEVGVYAVDARVEDSAPVDARGPDATSEGPEASMEMDATFEVDATAIGDAAMLLDADAMTSTDGGRDAGLSRCPSRPSALFCDGFESAGLGGWDYEVETSGSAGPTTAQAYAGGIASLECRTTNSSADTAARYGVDLQPALTGGDVWLRARYFLPSSVSIPNYVSIASISEAQDPFNGVHVLVAQDHVDIENSLTNQTATGSLALTRDTWVCLEAHLAIGAPNGRFEVFLDGSSSAQITTITSPAEGYSLVEVGIHYAPPMQGSLQLFIDDVVVAKQRIGCL
jgi:hypothetical protein